MRGRPKKNNFPAPSPERLEIWATEMREAGETPPVGAEEFKAWMKRNGERELWWFSRWILDNSWLSQGTFHRTQVCPYLTDFTSGRFKLLQIPMGCLKTTVASRSLPLHALIQPTGHNIYFANKLGRNVRVLLGNENEKKSMDNLQVSKTHLEQNPKLRWLWPEVCWPDGKAESGSRWTDRQIQVPRTGIFAEASITAAGVNTGIIGGYFDIIVADDLATQNAANQPPLMDRVKKFRRAMKTRFYDKARGIYIGVATSWGMNDVCVEWQRDPDFQVEVRSIIERDKTTGKEVALWPEHYPLDWCEKTRKTMDPIEWALWYMNQPVPQGYTALKWSDVREYESRVMGDPDHPTEVLEFSDAPQDEMIVQRHDRIAHNLGFRLGTPLFDPANAKPRKLRRQPRDADDYADQASYLWSKYPSVEQRNIRDEYPNKIPKVDDL
jgi:hypothetical protein